MIRGNADIRRRPFSSRRLSVVLLGILIVCAGGWSLWPEAALPQDAKADLVVVRKSARRMELYRGSELLKAYPISLGRHPVGKKQQQGDGRTPEGEYRLDYRNPNSSFHKALHISYPQSDDVATARMHGVEPGGLVMVHGLRNDLGWLGRLHRFVDWTDGCVAVTNGEIDEIWRAVPDGTKIVLQP
jgi:murein L,D-transpeptidase YafK